MRKKMNLLALLLFSFHFLYSQCITPPAFPVCNGTEPLVANSDNIAVAQTKYFYGAPATVSNVKLIIVMALLLPVESTACIPSAVVIPMTLDSVPGSLRSVDWIFFTAAPGNSQTRTP